MAFSCKVGAFNTGTGIVGTTIAITGFGFTPGLIFFFCSGRTETTDTAGRADIKRGFGIAVSPTDRRFMTSFAQDTPTTTLTNKAQGNAHCMGMNTVTDVNGGLLDVQSMDADGCTLIIDAVFASSIRVHYLALPTGYFTNVIGGNFTKVATTTGNQDITSLAFQPDGLLLMSCNHGSNANGISPDAGFYLAAVAGGNNVMVGGGSNDADGTSTTFTYATDAQLMALSSANLLDLDTHGSFVSFLSNGFRINWTVNNAASTVFNFVAWQGGNVQVGSLLTQTDTTTPIAVTTPLPPIGTLLFSHCKAESTSDVMQDDDEMSIGAFTSTTERGAHAVADDDNAATAITSTAVEHDACYVNLNANTGAVEGVMGVNAVSATGFELIMTDADPVQAFVGYLTFMDNAAVGHPAQRRLGLSQFMRPVEIGRKNVKVF